MKKYRVLLRDTSGIVSHIIGNFKDVEEILQYIKNKEFIVIDEKKCRYLVTSHIINVEIREEP